MKKELERKLEREEKKEQKKGKSNPRKEIIRLVSALLFVPGFLLIGLAFGVLLNRILVSLLFGLGVGFVVAAIFTRKR